MAPEFKLYMILHQGDAEARKCATPSGLIAFWGACYPGPALALDPGYFLGGLRPDFGKIGQFQKKQDAR
jgi:hypothetical protein